MAGLKALFVGIEKAFRRIHKTTSDRAEKGRCTYRLGPFVATGRKFREGENAKIMKSIRRKQKKQYLLPLSAFLAVVLVPV